MNNLKKYKLIILLFLIFSFLYIFFIYFVNKSTLTKYCTQDSDCVVDYCGCPPSSGGGGFEIRSNKKYLNLEKLLRCGFKGLKPQACLSMFLGYSPVPICVNNICTSRPRTAEDFGEEKAQEEKMKSDKCIEHGGEWIVIEEGIVFGECRCKSKDGYRSSYDINQGCVYTKKPNYVIK